MRFSVRPDAAHADAGIIDDRFNRAKARASRGDGALAACGMGKIGEDGMKAILTLIIGLRVPGREPVERFGIAIDRGDAMTGGKERIGH